MAKRHILSAQTWEIDVMCGLWDTLPKVANDYQNGLWTKVLATRTI